MLWLGVMDTTGSAFTSPADTVAEKVAQVLLTVDGMALLPLVTAIIVGARLTGTIRSEPRPRGGHVIVVGGGEIGTRVPAGCTTSASTSPSSTRTPRRAASRSPATWACRW